MKSRNNFGIILLISSIFLTSCHSTPIRNFLDADLLMDETAIPDGWIVIEHADKATRPNEGQENLAYVTFAYTNTTYLVRGGEEIYRYSSSDKASWHYDRFERANFNDASVYRTTPWQTPDDFNFSSSVAAKWRFACAGSNFTIGTATGNNSTQCMYLAQYDEFLVFFSITTEIDGHSFITSGEVTPIIKAIDQKMSDHLKPTPQP